MCIGRELSRTADKKLRQKLSKRGYVRVFKRVNVRKTGFASIVVGSHLVHRGGIEKAKRHPSYDCYSLEDVGFHGYLSKRQASDWGGDKVIECLVHPSWIKRLGSGRSILLNYICYPKFPNTKVTVREFRKQYKEWKAKQDAKK